MSRIKGKTILITGGASGLGLSLGKLFLNENCRNLVIWDINDSKLKTLSEEFKSQGLPVTTYCVDVTHTKSVISTFQEMKSQNLEIDILINNAGIIVGKKFIDHSHEDIDRTMNLNSAALMHIAKIALKNMIQQKHGHIVNIASAAGMVSNPLMSVYCASKWAVIGWSDSLRLELESSYPDIKVTTVTPYYIDTGMFEGVSSPWIPILHTDRVASQIIKGIKKDQLFVRMPFLINFLPLAKGLLPQRLFDYIVGDLLGVYKSMRTFKSK